MYQNTDPLLVSVSYLFVSIVYYLPPFTLGFEDVSITSDPVEDLGVNFCHNLS